VVYGVRSERAGESRFKKKTAALFYRLLNRVSEVPIPLDTGDFRLMDRAVVDVLKTMPERHRFLRGMVSWIGFDQTGLAYNREARLAGTTKYPLRKMIRFASDGMVSFSTARSGLRRTWVREFRARARWHRLRVRAASLHVRVGAGLDAPLHRRDVPRWRPARQHWITGEYVGRIFEESKRRPLYIVRERIGFGAEKRNALSSMR
jgi:dolichol-phosphate mannosyltransferase